VVVGRDMIDCKDLLHGQTGLVMILWFVRVVPDGSSAGRERHHDTIRSEQLST